MTAEENTNYCLSSVSREGHQNFDVDCMFWVTSKCYVLNRQVAILTLINSVPKEKIVGILSISISNPVTELFSC